MGNSQTGNFHHTATYDELWKPDFIGQRTQRGALTHQVYTLHRL